MSARYLLETIAAVMDSAAPPTSADGLWARVDNIMRKDGASLDEVRADIARSERIAVGFDSGSIAALMRAVNS